MSLSLVILFLIPVFLIPAFLLPRNKLSIYTGALIIAVIPVALLNLIEVWMPQIGLEEGIGGFFEVIFSFLIREKDLMTRRELLHIYAWLGYLVMFVIVYLIAYLILKNTYMGTNPSVHKPLRTLFHILLSTVFFVLTYLMMVLFLTEIRQCFGMEDGFLSFIFEAVYPIGA